MDGELNLERVFDRWAMTAEQTDPLMSEEQLKAFLEKVKGDSSLQEKLKASKSLEEVKGIAKDHGHEMTADKLDLLSDEELEGVAGGQSSPTLPICGQINFGCCTNTGA